METNLSDLKLGQQRIYDYTAYSCFGFENKTPDDLHCTHKFFGNISEKDLERVVKICDVYFAKNPFKPFTIRFDREDWFGLNKDVRVLRPSVDNWRHQVLLDLRSKLDPFREDNFPYSLHVTTDMDVCELPFTRYILSYNKRIIREYR